MCLADVTARSVLAPAEIPVGVVTALAGAGLPRRDALQPAFARPDGGRVIPAVACASRRHARRHRCAARRGLTVGAGDWFTIIGPNGAGKSTLLAAVAGVLPTSAGRVEVHGIAVDGLGRAQGPRRGAGGADTHDPRGLTVEDYAARPDAASAAHRRVRRRRQEIVDGVLARLDLGRFRARRVDSLSGGDASAPCSPGRSPQAPVLLLDEPTSALDIGFQQDVLDVVDELRHEATTVVATMHDLTLCAQYSDQLALLTGGYVVDTGDPLALLDADRLGDAFGARVEVLHLDGRLLVVPTRRRRTTTNRRQPTARDHSDERR